jgi:glycosyltransferase 2 family protein
VSFQWDLFFATFAHVDWIWMIAAILLVFVTYIGRALRWQVMLRPIRPDASLWRINTATMIGFAAIVLLGRPGELVRPYLISVKENTTFSSQMAAWLLERILDLFAVLLIFGFALNRIPAHETHLGVALQWVLRTGGYLVAGLGALALVLLIAFRNFSEGSQARILAAVSFLPENYIRKIQKTLSAFATGMQATRNTVQLLLLLGYTVFEWVSIVGVYYFIFQSFPITSRFSLGDTLVFVGFVAFGSLIQIPGIGGGVQVVAAVVLTEVFRLPLEESTGLALLIWIITFVVVVPPGLILAFHEGINWRNLRRIPEDVAA